MNVDLKKLSFAGFLVSIGIVFGDIGTSPLYTYTAIIGGRKVTELIALGGVSAIFWTLFFQTTLKYVFITLKADNNGEGGIFSLYTLIRKYKKWLLFPALAGGAFLLADSVITPPISVASAIEGLKPGHPHLPVMGIVISILVGLFILQRKGTSFIGNLFGPIMMLWFTMIGVLGTASLFGNFHVFKALNPYWAIKLLVEYPGGFWLLGGVFLCTTGAEALYSDLGHCGRKNIQISWLYVKICLVLSYFGQAAWLLHPDHINKPLSGLSPFFAMVPTRFLIPAIVIATAAAIIASQALISGSFTLVAEAIRLNLWPRHRVIYPSTVKGQVYIPVINWILMTGCILVVLYFKESKNMEAAFGLSVTLTMLMTTILLTFYLYVKKVNRLAVFSLLALYLFIEGSFLVANLKKFPEGGWITLLAGVLIFTIMYIWFRASKIKSEFQKFTDLRPFIPVLKELSNDSTVPKHATNLVYLTSADNHSLIEETTIYSILYKQPKRADVYWFVHLDVVDEPHKMTYKVNVIEPEEVIRIDFKLGFRDAPKINFLFRKVVEEMVKNKEVNIQSRYTSLDKHNITGDFRFVIMKRFLSVENELPFWKGFIMKAYFVLRYIGLSEEKEFGLDYSNLTIERFPLILNTAKNVNLTREE
ncbi:MAG: KUP/HAK/KT family potassium transporter [Bacteroidia bacterium]|nr:KUP/HAK/KT family potassium transporter [Bacteroidia bacterium]